MTSPSIQQPPFEAHLLHLKGRVGQTLLPKELSHERGLLHQQQLLEFLEEHLRYCADILADPHSTADDIDHARFEMAKAEPHLALTRITQALHSRAGAGVMQLVHDQYQQMVVAFYEAREVANRSDANVADRERLANYQDAVRCLNEHFLRLPPNERPLLIPEDDLRPR